MRKLLVGLFIYCLMMPAEAVVVSKGTTVTLPIENTMTSAFLRPSLGYTMKHVEAAETIDSVYTDENKLFTVAGQIISIWQENLHDKLEVIDRFDIGFSPSAMAVSGGRLFVGNAQGDFFVVDPFKDEQSLYFKLHAEIQAISVAENKVYAHLLSGDVVVLAFDILGHLYEQEQFYIGAQSRGLSYEMNNVFYYKGSTLYYAVDGASAFSSWDTGSNIHDFVIVNDQVYVSTDNGVVVAKLQKNKWVWHSSYRGIGQIDKMFEVNGRLIAAAHSGNAYAFEMVRDDHLEMVNMMQGSKVDSHFFVLNDQAYRVVGKQLSALNFSSDMPIFSNEFLDEGQGVNYGGQRKIAIDGQTMYVADWFSGMHIYDISNASKPIILSSVHTPGSSKGVVIQNGIAYVADDDHGLQVVDVRDPRNSEIIAELALQGLAYTPIIADGRLYMASHRGGVQIIDIQTPSDPVLLGGFNTPGMAWSLKILGNRMFVADDEAGLLSLDISNPSQIKLLDRLDLGGRAEDVLLDGDIAYVAVFDYGVKKVDVSDPEHLVEISGIPLPGNTRGLDMSDDHLFVAAWKAGLFVLDKGSLEILSQQDTPGAAWGVKVFGQSVYVADWWAGMVTLVLSKHSILHIADEFFRRDAVFDFVIQDSFLYVAQGQAGLQVFEVSNGMNPTWVSGADANVFIDHLVANQQALYAWGDDQSLRIYDRSHPFDTRYQSQIYLDKKVKSVAVRKDKLFVGSENGLSVYDVSDVFEPIQLQKLDLNVKSLAVSNRYMAVLENQNTLSIWRVDQGATLVNLQRIPFAEPVQEIQIQGEVLWLIDDAGVIKKRALDDVDALFSVVAKRQYIDHFLVTDDAIYVSAEKAVSILDINGQTLFEFPISTPVKKMLLHWDDLKKYGEQQPRADVLLIAGGKAPIAIDLAYPQISLNQNKLKIDVPMQAPAGDYDLVLNAQSSAKKRIRHKVLRVKNLRFSKPKMSLDDFQKRLQQHKKKSLNGAD